MGTSDKRFAILIDAGSSENPIQDLVKLKENQTFCNSIKSKICEYVDDTTKFLIVITHGDQDHYNKLKDILDMSRTMQTGQKQARDKKGADQFVIGGAAANYFHVKKEIYRSNLPQGVLRAKNFQKIVIDAHKETNNPHNPLCNFEKTLEDENLVILSEEDDTTTINQKISQFFGAECLISIQTLSSQKLTSRGSFTANDDDKKNESSIVTRVEYTVPLPPGHETSPPKKISFMIPDDAPGCITDQIIANKLGCDFQTVKTKTSFSAEEQLKLEPLRSTVLLASHHGSDVHETNNQKWFDAVKPQYVIFSHGSNKGHKHPHVAAIERALKKVGSQITTPHALICGVDDPLQTVSLPANGEISAQTFGSFKAGSLLEGFKILMTNLNVFSTYTQGHVYFPIDEQGNIRVYCTQVFGVERPPIPQPNSVEECLLFQEADKPPVLTPLANMLDIKEPLKSKILSILQTSTQKPLQD